MYEKYLTINNIPAGAILKRILPQKGISQKKPAEVTGILPQRINDYITGKRRFTPEASLNIEKQLGISISGLFYHIQSNYDIYLTIQAGRLKQHSDFSSFRKSLFRDTEGLQNLKTRELGYNILLWRRSKHCIKFTLEPFL